MAIANESVHPTHAGKLNKKVGMGESSKCDMTPCIPNPSSSVTNDTQKNGAEGNSPGLLFDAPMVRFESALYMS